MKSDARGPSHLELAQRVMALRDRLAAEAADAAALCEKVLAGPQAWWGQRLRAGRGPTVGLVQTLLRRMRAEIETSPETAQAITALAVELSNEIDAASSLPVLVDLVRAQALRDHAYVLSFRGLFAEALESAGQAERLFAGNPAAAYEAARLSLVKAAIFRNTGRTQESVTLTRDAAATFLRFGDRRRYAEARLFEAATLYAAGAVDRALEIWTPLEHAPALDEAGRLRVAYNIALCLADLGRYDEAIPYLSRCTMQFALRRMATESTRSRAALGKALLGAGQPAGALIVLRQAGRELDALGLIFDAGLVALQEAETLLALDRPEEVPAVCRAAIALFTRAGVTAYAATALAYLREATAVTPAAPKLVRAAYASLRQSRVQLQAAPAPPPS